MSNTLAENFTWTGKSNGSPKRRFYNTKLAKIFHRAAKKVRRIGQFTRSEFIESFQEILRSYKQTARNARISNSRGQRNRRMEDEEELFPDDDDMVDDDV